MNHYVFFSAYFAAQFNSALLLLLLFSAWWKSEQLLLRGVKRDYYTTWQGCKALLHTHEAPNKLRLKK